MVKYSFIIFGAFAGGTLAKALSPRIRLWTIVGTFTGALTGLFLSLSLG